MADRLTMTLAPRGPDGGIDADLKGVDPHDDRGVMK